MNFDHEPKYDFADVLIKPKRSILKSRADVQIERTFKFKWAQNKTLNCVPIIASNMDTVGTFTMAEALAKFNVCTALHKFYTVEQLTEWFKTKDKSITEKTFLSVGFKEYDKFLQVQKQVDFPINIHLDVPSAYIENFVDLVHKVRDENKENLILAGSVVTGEMTEALILAGADIVKVGIGSGAMCLTRRVAGVGVPQLSAILECADAAHGLKGHICSDGGIVYPGDLGKAFGGGTDFVMIGTVLAGHAESELPVEDNKVVIYGMSSDTAQVRHYGEVKSYRASEGRTMTIPYKGPVEDTIQQYLGGLRSTMTYIGAEKIKEIPKRTSFIVVNRQLNTSVGA